MQQLIDKKKRNLIPTESDRSRFNVTCENCFLFFHQSVDLFADRAHKQNFIVSVAQWQFIYLIPIRFSTSMPMMDAHTQKNTHRTGEKKMKHTHSHIHWGIDYYFYWMIIIREIQLRR